MYDVWKNALSEIERKVSPSTFAMRFKDTSIISCDKTEDGKYNVVIGVRNTFYVKQLNSRFFSVIVDALKNNDIEVNDIQFVVQTQEKSKVRAREVKASDLVSNPTVRPKQNKAPISSTFSENGLNSKYTLDSFVIGSNNDLAVGAAKSIIDAPGTRLNPLFLYGGPGLGKTHLVQAIGNE